MSAPRYIITRSPGAPPRRGGREWPLGQTTAALDAATLAAVQADPGYHARPAQIAPKAATRRPSNKE